MAKIETRPWDAVEHLETEEDMAAYLDAALEEGDPALIAAALGDIARAKGVTRTARENGLGREETDAQYERACANADQPLGKEFEGSEAEGVWHPS